MRQYIQQHLENNLFSEERIFWCYREIHDLQAMYCISPNKRACLNTRTPDFWVWSFVTQQLPELSEWNFQGLYLRYLEVRGVNFTEIGQV